MDQILIDGLEVFANHGVLEAETTLGQKFIISAALTLSLRPAGKTDDLTKTVNYAEVANAIRTIMTENTYQLIETCAEEIAAHILLHFPLVRALRLTIEKPWAPVGQSVRNLSVSITRAWHRVYLGLGANMGDAHAALEAAIAQIVCDDLRLVSSSRFYTTKPISDIVQDDYQNAVIEVETTMPPQELMAHLLAVEASLGRERSVRWGPRTIDIDVLAYDDLVSDDRDIILPHPRMHERLFVLVPLCEINPNYVHPLLKQRAIDLKDALEQTQTL